MKITLYKNCILTNSFSEVCDVFHKDENGKTTLERYLDTLEKLVIDAGDVYYTNSGKFSFDMVRTGYENTDFYVFNYMKFEDEANVNFKRYCFIDAIAVVNNIAVVSYIEDVWSCYAPSMKMRKSLLTRSRIVDYGTWQVPFYSPGMEYQGNNFAKIVQLDERNASGGFPVNIIFQAQLYQLSQQGVPSKRIVVESALQKSSDKTYDFTLNAALGTVQGIVTESSTKKVTWNSEEYYMEIYNILLVPSSLNVINQFVTSISPTIVYNEGLNIVWLSVLDQQKKECKTYTIPHDFKKYMIGTYTNAFSIVQNGSDIPVKITAQCGFWDFSIYIEFQNQVIDITNSFSVNIPISVQTADVTQQQATARELADLNAKLGIASGAMQIGQGISSFAEGGAKTAFGLMRGHAGSVLSGASEMNSAPFAIGRGVMNIIGSAKQLDIANRAMYVTNRGVKANANATINAMYGLVIFEMQPDNEVEVQANIDNAGYLCNEIVDNLLETITTGQTNKYNVMQFEYVNIYGAFTQRIADALREILYNGFKIWYDETAI